MHELFEFESHEYHVLLKKGSCTCVVSLDHTPFFEFEMAAAAANFFSFLEGLTMAVGWPIMVFVK